MSMCWLSIRRFFMHPTNCWLRTGKSSGSLGTPPRSKGPVRSRDLTTQTSPFSSRAHLPLLSKTHNNVAKQKGNVWKIHYWWFSCTLETEPSPQKQKNIITSPVEEKKSKGGTSFQNMFPPTSKTWNKRYLFEKVMRQTVKQTRKRIFMDPVLQKKLCLTFVFPLLTGDLLFGSRLASLSGAGVVSDHVTKSQGYRGITVIHRHYDNLLLWGAHGQTSLVQNRL